MKKDFVGYDIIAKRFSMRLPKREFDFKEYTASAGRHSIHQYPAMLHYKLVEELIKQNNAHKIYDPFCGSGVTIVEALKQNKIVYGSDINPLSLLIADVRSKNFDIGTLKTIYNDLSNRCDSLKPDIPNVKNIDFWFKEKVIEDLGKIRNFIVNIDNEDVRKFFLVVFSQTVRATSNNKSGEFKRFRRKDLENFDPDVFKEFSKLFNNYLNVLEKLPSQDFKLFKHDSREKINLEDIDLIITSPPYGDSKTTVAYGQFSSFSLDWMKGLNPYGDEDLKIDSKMLGGRRTKRNILPSEHLEKVLDQIDSVDKKRAEEVFSFFNDLYISCKNLVSVLSKNGKIIFVVGNRRVKNVEIPMDYIVAEFFEDLGMECKNIFIREISNKRMPIKNSPTNKTGQTSKTMTKEYIVIIKR